MIWTEAAGPWGAEVTALAGGANGVLYVNSSEGLFRDSKRIGDPVAALATDPDGAAWALDSGAVRKLDGAATIPLPRLEESCESINFTAFAVSRQIWVAMNLTWLGQYPDPALPGIFHAAPVTRQHVYRFGSGGWEKAGENELVTGFAFDSKGRVWRATSAGLFEGDRCALRYPVTCVAVDASDRIVAGSGVPAFLSPDFRPIPARLREKGDWGSLEANASDFRVLVRGPDGAVWGGMGDGVVRLKGVHWESVNAGLLVVPGSGMRQKRIEVTALAFAGDAVYAGTRALGLFCRNSYR